MSVNTNDSTRTTSTGAGSAATTGTPRSTSSSHNAPDPSLRDRAGDALEGARTRAVDAYGSAREKAVAARARAGDGIDEAPFLALAGGLAVGVLLAALLPRSQREAELLGPIGGKITGGARSAIDAAKEAGRDKLNELNLNRESGASALQTILKGVSDAALGAVKKPG